MRSSSDVRLENGSVDNQKAEKSACNSCSGSYELAIIGLGSEGEGGITIKAKEYLEKAQAVYGYKLYMEQAEPFLTPETLKISSGMTHEIKRAEEAIDKALSGLKTVVVSGGDAGVYAMSGAVFEVAAAKKISLGDKKGDLKIEVISGVPAFIAASSLLGAPLTHDFCAISLSDRLTKWELIQKRLRLAAEGDFVISIYNPKSRGRDWQFAAAVDILAEILPGSTPVGVVSRAGRDGEKVLLSQLDQLKDMEIDMQTLVVIGNKSTFTYCGRMITPRGYIEKYGVDSK